ncbi:MAG: hypothetical protein A49_24520 [Methyloceanibacter sp.]|nr:MAG: hypothetical protein A49_24520 [Methyloceanibacter sp.]
MKRIGYLACRPMDCVYRQASGAYERDGARPTALHDRLHNGMMAVPMYDDINTIPTHDLKKLRSFFNG